MKKIYRTIEDVLSSPWSSLSTSDLKRPSTDRVLRSTKLEDSIYEDLRAEDGEMDEMDQTFEVQLENGETEIVRQ